MEQLVIKSDFALYRDLNNVDYDDRVVPAIIKAQRSYIRSVLGKALYKDLIDNQTETKYSDLLNGAEYTDSSGNSVDFYGLKPVIILYSYGLFIKSDDVRVTRAGIKKKVKAESENVSEEKIESERQRAFNEATKYMREVLDYINTNKSDFPLFNQCQEPTKGLRVGVNLQNSVYSNDKSRANVVIIDAYSYYQSN